MWGVVEVVNVRVMGRAFILGASVRRAGGRKKEKGVQLDKKANVQLSSGLKCEKKKKSGSAGEGWEVARMRVQKWYLRKLHLVVLLGSFEERWVVKHFKAARGSESLQGPNDMKVSSETSADGYRGQNSRISEGQRSSQEK